MAACPSAEPWAGSTGRAEEERAADSPHETGQFGQYRCCSPFFFLEVYLKTLLKTFQFQNLLRSVSPLVLI